jgi:hypothetical protein
VASAAPVPPPTRQQLRTLFVHSAVPLVGFGFIDQIVMVRGSETREALRFDAHPWTVELALLK